MNGFKLIKKISVSIQFKCNAGVRHNTESLKSRNKKMCHASPRGSNR